MNDNPHPSLAPLLNPIPFEAVGKPGRRASERDRDNAAIELAAYVIGILKFDEGSIAHYRAELLKRANKVRRTQGNSEIVFVTETAAAIRAAAEPMSKPAFDDLEAGLRALLSQPEQMP